MIKESDCFEHYYKLRMSYQSDKKTLSIAGLCVYLKTAREMISDGRYITSFEIERLHDFVDELEIEIENFHLRATRPEQKTKFRSSLEQEDLRVKALCENIFEDSNGDIIAIVKKENLKNLSETFEKIAILSAIISTRSFNEAAKMLKMTIKTLRTLRAKYKI